MQTTHGKNCDEKHNDEIKCRRFPRTLVKVAVCMPQVELTTCSLQRRYRWKLQHST
jgi:hypothetical protein